jgi:tRNA(Ile)-lysidine synthase
MYFALDTCSASIAHRIARREAAILGRVSFNPAVADWPVDRCENCVDAPVACRNREGGKRLPRIAVMADAAALSVLARTVRESGLIAAGSGGVVLVSGGADSAAAAAGLVTELGATEVVALHLNYGLRADSDRDERTCEELCARLGVELEVEHPELGRGNVQAEARDARYAAAERLRLARGLKWVATGHTRTDLAETVLYRLATSPGRRALLGLRARSGDVIRPILSLQREETRRLVEEAGLPFSDDPTNAESLYARNRIRNEVLPVLREVGPEAEATIAETHAELAEEAETLERLAAQALSESGADAAGAIGRDALAQMDPVMRRLVFRQLAERTAGERVPLGRSRAAEIWRLVDQPEGGVIELGGGVEAHAEHGHVRFTSGETAEVPERALTVPGVCRFGTWEVRAELAAGVPAARGPDLAVLDPATLGRSVAVRGWRDGDRMRPLGLGGTKSLQDLFTDNKVPRSLRRALPVVVANGRIAWVAGVAVSEEFAARPGAPESAVLRASQAGT